MSYRPKGRATSGPRRAVGYFRVSSARQATDDRHSLPIQQARFDAHCLAADLIPAGTYIDVMSGRRDDRPQYQAMLADARAGNFDTVVVQYLDRFGRDEETILLEYLNLKKNYGIDVACTDEQIESFIHLALSSWKAGEDVKRTSKRVRDAAVRAVRAGRLWGKVPYGYRKLPDKSLVLAPDEVAAVRLMGSLLIDENLSLYQISAELLRRGYRRPNGLPWETGNIWNVLRRPINRGEYRFGVKLGQPDAFIIPDAAPAIFSEDEQRRIFDALATRRVARKGHSLRSEFLLSGILLCGVCGCHMSGGKNGSCRYYRCGRARNGARCSYNYQRSDRLEQSVLQAIAEIADERAIVLPPSTDVRNFAGERSVLQRRLDEVEARFLRILRAYTDGLLADAEQYKVANRSLRDERDLLRAQLSELELDAVAVEHTEQQRLRLPMQIRSFLDAFEAIPVQQQNARLGEIIRAITVWPDHHWTATAAGLPITVD